MSHEMKIRVYFFGARREKRRPYTIVLVELVLRCVFELC